MRQRDPSGLIKHTHHDMDVDKPGKDSYELAQGWRGANHRCQPTAMGLDDGNTRRRRAGSTFSRKSNGYLKAGFDSGRGFKHEEIAKIVLFRDGAGHRPEELVIDRHVIAVASDVPLNLDVALLDINDVEGLADFVVEWMQKQDG
ncbi:molybdopterin-guanine dinucleotide biosynthesis protein B [Escherichia coli]|uniref:Molybdopterin-guanine dinucleotide biosynthesis protein B n=1 Tax=Escherichia coli TaxID=562 RepID=A0A376WBU9_ECOLX|nr:molybdopterin-guanine dinucleotide biosynthesis protein B [Escherichia coli]